MEFFKALWNDIYSVFGKEVTLGTNTITTLNIIVWSLFIGFFIAITITLYNKLVVGSAVRRLVASKALTEDRAVSASKIGCKNIFIRFSFRKNSTLRKMLCTVGEETGSVTADNMDKIKFYIPERSVRKAEVLFGKKGITFGNILLGIIALLIVAMLAFLAADNLISMTGDFANSIKSESNIT